MLDAISEFFSSTSFMPHGHCYLWTPALVWLQVLSNGFIGLSYVAISLALILLVRRGKYLPFKGMALAFGTFIITCGLTHFMDILVIWHPYYWLDTALRSITAAASVTTALLLPPLIPRAVSLARGMRAMKSRGVKLEAAVQGLEQMYDQAKQLDELKTQFFANVSHELRTPLALILAPLKQLRTESNLTVEQRRDVDVATRNAETLLRHVEDLLDVARLESKRMELRYAAVDLTQLVRSVAAHFDGYARSAGIEFTVETPERLDSEVDHDKMYRVLLNLMSNAFKFVGKGGRVRCTLSIATGAEQPHDRRSDSPSPPGGLAMLEVADSGPGIPPAQRKIVFERFRQLDGSADRRFGGTGLGLAIVKDFVELHGGHVDVASATEGGASLCVELPLRAPAGRPVSAAPAEDPSISSRLGAQAVGELPATGPVEAAARRRAGAPKVLIVEDNDDMRRFIADSLSSEYDIELAADGATGLTKALSFHPDLIISDIMMPQMSGDQLVRRVRAEPQLADVRILLLTAKATDKLRLQVLRDGAQDYLTKPFLLDELRVRAANLITIKRTQDVLQGELDIRSRNLEELAHQVTQQKHELAVALRSAEAARAEAQRANRSMSEFLAMVSHELRAPLTTLLMQIERLGIENERLGSQSLGALRMRMLRSAERLSELVENVLQYVRMGSGMQPNVVTVDIVGLVHETTKRLEPRAKLKGLTLSVDLPSSLPPLRSDPDLLRAALSNLIANGIKFSESGSVRVSVKATDADYQLTVSDTGPGIPHELRSRLFEPFAHGASVEQKHESGFGLGLALVKRVLVELGGSIHMHSTPADGSTFTVTLPAVAARPSSTGDPASEDGLRTGGR